MKNIINSFIFYDYSRAFENHTDDKEVLLHQNEIELNQTGVTKKYTADVEQELVMYEKKRQDIKKFLLLVNELYERFPRMFRYRLSHVITYRVASVFQPPVLYQDNVAEAYRHAEIASLAKKINSVNNTDPLRYDSSLRDDSYLQDLIVVQIYKVTATKSQVEKNAGIVNSQRTNGEFDDDTILEGSTAVSDDSDESLTSDPSTLEVGLATSTGVDGYLEVLRRRKQDRAILHKLRYRGLRLRNYGN